MIYKLVGKREFEATNKKTGKDYVGANLYFEYELDPDDSSAEGVGVKEVFCKPENVENYESLQIGREYKLYYNEYKTLESIVSEDLF